MDLKEFETDWRNMGQMEYLFKKTFKLQKYFNVMKRDHEHCQFCWETFSGFPGAESEGYCTIDGSQYWVCCACFNELKEIFKWNECK